MDSTFLILKPFTVNGMCGMKEYVQLHAELEPKRIRERSWWKKQTVEPAVVKILRL